MPILDVCDWHLIFWSSGSWDLFSKAHRSHLLPRGGKRGEPVLRQRRKMRHSMVISSVYFCFVLGCNVTHQSWTKALCGSSQAKEQVEPDFGLGSKYHLGCFTSKWSNWDLNSAPTIASSLLPKFQQIFLNCFYSLDSGVMVVWDFMIMRLLQLD